MEITQADHELIKHAEQTITRHFSPKHHRLATCIATKSGQIITGINVEGSFGCNDVCAEQITLGNVLSHGVKDIACMVTVKHPKAEDPNQSLRVVSPCGKCRELILDYAPEAWVIIKNGSTLIKVHAKDLLPYRYSKA
ncbi:MAG: cytidine deaminase [Candidatus Pacebacteria bacterium]|nr:cytidine deaminase [Candidatus Paceibacterota bacterium]